MIFAVGGVSSFLGAMIAGRLPRFGIGAVMVASLLLAAVGEAFIPLATAANAIGVLFLIGQQIVADSALTVYDINQVSLRQAIAPAHVLGRINASVHVTEIGAVLLGTFVAGYMGETRRSARDALGGRRPLPPCHRGSRAVAGASGAAHPGNGGGGREMTAREDVFDRIRTAVAEVARRAKFVRLVDAQIAPYAASLAAAGLPELVYDTAHHASGSVADTVAFQLTLDTVNFGSGLFSAPA